jgi:protein-tyrosine-phosphatase
MDRQSTRVLFVSRRNAFRSLLAEACLRHLGRDKFKVYSCGVPSEVADAPNGLAVITLQSAGIPTSDLACKGWAEYTRNGTPMMDFVISLDAQTFRHHPKWPGQPETALWSYPELPPEQGNSVNPNIESIRTLVSLRRRIELLVSLCYRVQTNSQMRDDLRDLAHM